MLTTKDNHGRTIGWRETYFSKDESVDVSVHRNVSTIATRDRTTGKVDSKTFVGKTRQAETKTDDHKESEEKVSEMTTQAALPQVGIFYVVGDKLFIDSTPLSAAGHHGDNLVHERSHYEYWAQLVKMGAVPRAACEDFPRGRVAYGNKIGKFFLLADACILGEKKVLDAIMSRLHLPVDDTETSAVSIYRCHRCLGRIR